MDTETRNQAYDVIVIGAGWSGLMACKYCVAEGLRTVVLESRDTIGGVWAYTDDQRYGGVTKTTLRHGDIGLCDARRLPVLPLS